MKTILILANSSEGLYDFRRELISELTKIYRVCVSVPDATATDKLEAAGCQVLHTPMNRRGVNPIEDLGLLAGYRALMKKLRPACVLTYTVKPNIYGGLAAGERRLPCIPTVTGLGTAFQTGGMVKKLVQFLYSRAFRRAGVVFFQNEVNREVFLDNKLVWGRTRVVPGSGVNVRYHVKEEYPGREKPRFLYVGRLMKEKGIEEFFFAAETYADRAEFVIIGEYEEDYRRQVEEAVRKGSLAYHGPQREVRSFYRKADAVIVASYHEGMSNVVLEAASTARPVLATRIFGCREAVEEGVTGLLFAPRSREALGEAVEKFLAMSPGERARMGLRARRKMEREFDRKLVVQAYLEEINNAVKTAD